MIWLLFFCVLVIHQAKGQSSHTGTFNNDTVCGHVSQSSKTILEGEEPRLVFNDSRLKSSNDLEGYRFLLDGQNVAFFKLQNSKCFACYTNIKPRPRDVCGRVKFDCNGKNLTLEIENATVKDSGNYTITTEFRWVSCAIQEIIQLTIKVPGSSDTASPDKKATETPANLTFTVPGSSDTASPDKKATETSANLTFKVPGSSNTASPDKKATETPANLTFIVPGTSDTASPERTVTETLANFTITGKSNPKEESKGNTVIIVIGVVIGVVITLSAIFTIWLLHRQRGPVKGASDHTEMMQRESVN